MQRAEIGRAGSRLQRFAEAAAGEFYPVLSGTSMAAPHVTGVVSFLYALDPTLPSPTLTSTPIRDLLIANGATAVGTPAPLVDLFAAALDVDRIQGGDKGLRALVDIDDGTQDGNLRIAAAAWRRCQRISTPFAELRFKHPLCVPKST
jgi:subtilisin family serine protease